MTTDPDTKAVEINEQDLPLHCPLTRMAQWDTHPRVFLTLDEQGEALCPYCGTRYKLNAASAH